MNIFIICSVRGMDDEYRLYLECYTKKLEELGHKVHLPHRDTDQKATGLVICKQNANAIFQSDEVHIFYNKTSQGTHFDMGVAFAMNKTIKVIDSEPLTEGKSFANMLLEWEDK